MPYFFQNTVLISKSTTSLSLSSSYAQNVSPFLVSFTYKSINKDDRACTCMHAHTLAYTVPEPNSASLLDKIRPKFIVNVSPEMLHKSYQKLTLKVPTDYTQMSN